MKQLACENWDVSRLAPPFQEKYKLDEAVNGEDFNRDGTLDHLRDWEGNTPKSS